MNTSQLKNISIYILFLIAYTISSQSHAEQSIQNKVDTLTALINKVEAKGINAEPERMTLQLSNVFLEWAIWDENNIEINQSFYSAHPQYKTQAAELATALPAYERESVAILLDQAIDELQRIDNNEITRKPTPKIDYNSVLLNNGQLTQNNQPVFLSSYTWKPSNEKTNKYFGDLASLYLAPNFIKDKDGGFSSYQKNLLAEQNSTKIGQTFISHNAIPNWAYDTYDNFRTGERHYGTYDIDNPGAKQLFSYLFETYIPEIKGKRGTELGYMLFNEPSFFTQEGVWNTGEVSSFTHEKFRLWLAQQYSSINELNGLWQQNFTTFNDVTITVPIAGELRGSPIWYDWCRFNQSRISDWFTFLKTEIRKHDPNAKTHIKLMPWLWAGNARDHGMDFEALLGQGDIIGFDAKAVYSHKNGKTQYEWMDTYSYDWLPAMMSFDFFTSIQPNQLLWDSENHFVNTVSFQEKALDPAYINAVYWQAFQHGLSGSSTWVWGREDDGSIIQKDGANSSYITDVTHQPKALHAITRTFMNANAHATDLVALRKQAKPIRIFYSETSAINQNNYMTNIAKAYEKLYFDGIALGFTTQNIIEKKLSELNNNEANFDAWQYIIIQNSQHVTADELVALQAYLNHGGIIFKDSSSLLKNQHGQAHSNVLTATNGQIITYANLTDLYNKVSLLNEQKAILPIIQVQETEQSSNKTIAWKTVATNENSYVLSLINLGNDSKTINIETNSDFSLTIIDKFTGETVDQTPTLAPRELRFYQINTFVPPSEIPEDNDQGNDGDESDNGDNGDNGESTLDPNNNNEIETNPSQSGGSLNLFILTLLIICRKVMPNSSKY